MKGIQGILPDSSSGGNPPISLGFFMRILWRITPLVGMEGNFIYSVFYLGYCRINWNLWQEWIRWGDTLLRRSHHWSVYECFLDRYSWKPRQLRISGIFIIWRLILIRFAYMYLNSPSPPRLWIQYSRWTNQSGRLGHTTPESRISVPCPPAPYPFQWPS